MDQGTQEEVRPVYSYTEKAARVKIFINSKYRIRTYSSAKKVLDDQIISRILKKITVYIGPDYPLSSAEQYFTYLVAIVSGTQDVPQDILKEATEQLFTFLLFMRNDIESDTDPLATASVQQRLDLLASKLDIISNRQISELFHYLEIRDKKFLEIFEIIKTWIHTYKEPLEHAKEYFQDKVRKPEGK